MSIYLKCSSMNALICQWNNHPPHPSTRREGESKQCVSRANEVKEQILDFLCNAISSLSMQQEWKKASQSKYNIGRCAVQSCRKVSVLMATWVGDKVFATRYYTVPHCRVIGFPVVLSNLQYVKTLFQSLQFWHSLFMVFKRESLGERLTLWFKVFLQANHSEVLNLFMGIISPQGEWQLHFEWQKGALDRPMASLPHDATWNALKWGNVRGWVNGRTKFHFLNCYKSYPIL